MLGTESSLEAILIVQETPDSGLKLVSESDNGEEMMQGSKERDDFMWYYY